MGAGFFKASYFHDLSKVQFTDEQKAAIEQQIQEQAVMVYSKDYCPHCIKARRLLATHKVTAAKIVEINLEKDGLVQQAILYKITGQKTVPNIFIGGKHIGGNSELHKLASSGELKKLLDEAGVSHEF